MLLKVGNYMARYIYLEHYSADGGKLGLSDKVFSQLAKHSIKTIKEIVRDKNTIVQAAIKNNTVNYKIVVYVKKGARYYSMRLKFIIFISL